MRYTVVGRLQSVFFLGFFLLILNPLANSLEFKGRVESAATGVALSAATVTVDASGRAVVTDANGKFSIPGPDSGLVHLTASFVGYAPLKVKLSSHVNIVLKLVPVILPGEEVIVTTTRATTTMPVTHSNLSEPEIDRSHAAQDVPMLLSSQPGVYSYSDAGNGVGYSYMQIRGFEQRKVGVYLNGVPLNDPLSHSVYWVDMPDIMESASDVQIQRGVGNSLYGASAPGGVVSVELDPFGIEPKFRFTAGAGSYGTEKFSLEGSSGLIDNSYAVYGRFSRLVSDGYRESSWSDMWSYFFGLAKYSGKVTNRIYAFGGPERLHASWDGIDQAQLQANRRYNPYTYEYETDTFNQPHYQWLMKWDVSDRTTFRNTAFYVKGDGYFIQEKFGLSFAEADLDTSGTGVTQGDGVVQRHLQNDFFGVVPRLEWTHPGGTLTVGGELSRHTGYHFGEVLSMVPAPMNFRAGHDYYNYDVNKTTATIFGQESYSPTDALHLMAALQFQWKRYEQRNDRRNDVAYNVDYSFLTPRIGALYEFTPKLSGYVNFSLAQHEPVASEIYDPQGFEDPQDFFGGFSGGLYSDPIMQPERMSDIELGFKVRTSGAHVAVNGFLQSLTNEIVPGGGLDDDGNPIRANAGKSVHRGIEADVSVRPFQGVELTANATLSDNYFKDYIEKFNPLNPVDYSGNTISSFPGTMAQAAVHVRQPLNHKRSVTFLGGASIRHIGKIYLDNSQTENLTTRAYTVVDVRGGFAFALAGRTLEVEGMVYNATNALYSTFGYTWGTTAYYWPAAERNYFVRLRTGW